MGAYDRDKEECAILKDNTEYGEGLALVLDKDGYVVASYYDSGVCAQYYTIDEIFEILPDTKIKVFREEWIKKEELTWKQKYYELLEEYKKIESSYHSLRGLYKQLNRKVKVIKDLFNINLRNI